MKRFGEWMLIVVALGGLFLMAAAVLLCVYSSLQVPSAEVTLTIELSLPEKCRHLYDNGTDEWIECIGVGRK